MPLQHNDIVVSQTSPSSQTALSGQKRFNSPGNVGRNRARRAVFRIPLGADIGINRLKSLEAGSAKTLAFQDDFFIARIDQLEIRVDMINLRLGVALNIDQL